MTNNQTIWSSLVAKAKAMQEQTMQQMFALEPDRGQHFCLQHEDLYVDYSRNKIDTSVLDLLLQLAEQNQLAAKIEKLFSGQVVNSSENRAALHTLLRTPHHKRIDINGENVTELADRQRQKMYRLCNRLQAGELLGASGKAVTKLVNIGIGGSDLGPRLVLQALTDYYTTAIECDFVANVDPDEIKTVLDNSDPQTTLFIVVSKSFSTVETLTNANTAKRWLEENNCSDISQHFIAVSENAKAVAAYGIKAEYSLQIWPWVGGRYSIWSCVGFIACAIIGEKNFSAFLAGAQAMDTHFRQTQFSHNIPVMLALLSIWYGNLLNYPAHAIVPYAHKLRRLPDYLSQLIMESNGKSVSNNNLSMEHKTSPIIWGSVGSNAQHAFFQLLHQGNRHTTLDLIAVARSANPDPAHELLVANCIAQGKALLDGKTNKAQPYTHFSGNRPSTTIMLAELNPYSLGSLLAMYEHKTFVEAAIWDINPFDQWGVELGKTLAKDISTQLQGEHATAELDSSTAGLIHFYQQAIQKK